MRKIAKVTFIILIISLCACSTTEEKKEKLEKINGMNFPNFEESNTGLGRALRIDDTLKIKVRFNDSGEWGYRTEKIIVYRDTSRKLKARLVIARSDTVRLDDKKAIKTDTIKTLSPEDERLINLFIHRVVELSLNQEHFNGDRFEEEPEEISLFIDAGTQIEIKNSELFISYWNIDRLANTWYGRLRKRLFGIAFH